MPPKAPVAKPGAKAPAGKAAAKAPAGKAAAKKVPAPQVLNIPSDSSSDEDEGDIIAPPAPAPPVNPQVQQVNPLPGAVAAAIVVNPNALQPDGFPPVAPAANHQVPQAPRFADEGSDDESEESEESDGDRAAMIAGGGSNNSARQTAQAFLNWLRAFARHHRVPGDLLAIGTIRATRTMTELIHPLILAQPHLSPLTPLGLAPGFNQLIANALAPSSPIRAWVQRIVQESNQVVPPANGYSLEEAVNVDDYHRMGFIQELVAYAMVLGRLRARTLTVEEAAPTFRQLQRAVPPHLTATADSMMASRGLDQIIGQMTGETRGQHQGSGERRLRGSRKGEKGEKKKKEKKQGNTNYYGGGGGGYRGGRGGGGRGRGGGNRGGGFRGGKAQYAQGV